MAHKSNRSDGTVASTKTSFAIIEELAERPDGAEMTAIADELSVAKSTVYNHLNTLRKLGYVVKRENKYALGLEFLTLGDRARRRYSLSHFAKQEIQDIVEEVGERAQVMVEEDGRGVYIYQVKAESGIQTDSHVGTVVRLHATAVGKAYLAFLPESKRERILAEAPLSEKTPNTLTDRDDLRADLETIRERGYAVNEEEKTMGMRAVGAPIRSDDDGTVLGALSVSGPTTRLNGEWFREEIPEIVCQAVQVIGVRATYS